jgi:hypothetical protein
VHHHHGRGLEPLGGSEHGDAVAVRQLDDEDHDVRLQDAQRHDRLRGALRLPERVSCSSLANRAMSRCRTMSDGSAIRTWTAL